MITCKRFENGFEYLEITNNTANAKIALQGAHVFEYTRHNEAPILWVSECAKFETGSAIRGGIPICWPWFGMDGGADMPQHGFVRTMMWELKEQHEIDAHTSEVVLHVSHNTKTLKLFPYRFELALHVTVGERLELKLVTANTDDQPFRITQALHSYFTISDIENILITGLEERSYFDALTQTTTIQKGAVVFDQETDRVYEAITWPLELKDSERSIVVDAAHSHSCIVWNPWIEKCSRMSQMCSDSYRSMVCIETANAREDGVVIANGSFKSLKTVIS